MKLKEMKEYRIWQAMKARCYAPCNKDMGYYQKEGITVCDRWINDFWTFLKDMGNIPAENYSLDRIDNSKGYCPENCRWIPIKMQSRNRRNVIKITYKGETRPLKEWAHLLKVNYDTLIRRIRRGMTFENAICKAPIRYIEIGGKSQYVSDWCKEIGVSPSAVYSWKHKHKTDAKSALLHFMSMRRENNQW